MIALDPTPDVAKSRRRPVAKSSKPVVEKPMKIGLHISPESWRRLGIASTMEHKSQSQIVDELIKSNLRRWVIQDRSTRAAGEAVPVTGIDADPAGD